MHRLFRAGGVAALAACSALCAFAGDVPFYLRANVVAASSGRVEWSRAYTRRLELPRVSCEEGPFTCSGNEVYGQLYALAFVEEVVTGQDGLLVDSQMRERGRLLLAFDLGAEQEAVLEQALVDHLKQLSAKSFTLPHAGMGYLRAPFDYRVFTASSRSAWACKELNGSYTFDVLIREEEGHLGEAWSHDGDVARDACLSLERALRDSPSEKFVTLPDIRRQERQVVHLEAASTLEGWTWADRLAAIPTSARFEKGDTDGKLTGGIRDLRDGAFIGHEGRFAGVERDARIPASALEVLGAPMWVTRWTFESTLETFGEKFAVVNDRPSSILVAVLPIADPLMEELARSRRALDVPERRLLDAVLARFEKSNPLTPLLVEDALNTPDAWPAEGDWMVVSCRDDGTARYGVAPFAFVAEVTNPREACAALAREIRD